jgi:hypothetical protein
MRQLMERPRAGGTAIAGDWRERIYDSPPTRSTQGRFPVCELHGFRIVDHLPNGCPFRAENPLFGVHRYRERARKRECLTDDDIGAANDHHRADTCWKCVGRLSNHPNIRRLRGSIGLAP